MSAAPLEEQRKPIDESKDSVTAPLFSASKELSAASTEESLNAQLRIVPEYTLGADSGESVHLPRAHYSVFKAATSQAPEFQVLVVKCVDITMLLLTPRSQTDKVPSIDHLARANTVPTAALKIAVVPSITLFI